MSALGRCKWERRQDWFNGFEHLSRLTRRANLVFYSALFKDNNLEIIENI